MAFKNIVVQEKTLKQGEKTFAKTKNFFQLHFLLLLLQEISFLYNCNFVYFIVSGKL